MQQALGDSVALILALEDYITLILARLDALSQILATNNVNDNDNGGILLNNLYQHGDTYIGKITPKKTANIGNNGITNYISVIKPLT